MPGQSRNLAAADQLAHEVACFANTPGGGVLLVGIEDATGSLLGAGLDTEWLRHRIYERVDVAPLVEERVVEASDCSSCSLPSHANQSRIRTANFAGGLAVIAYRWIAPSGGCAARTVRAQTPWPLPPSERPWTYPRVQ